jgi:glycosyltransferase involved in cell wall biosynthesis
VRIVLTIHHDLDPNSGSPGSTLALADAYRRAGHEAELLSFDDLPRRLGTAARMLAFPALVAARLAGSLGRWCDVVDSSSGDAWLWSSRPGRALGPLLVTRSHGLEHREHLELLRDHAAGMVALRRRYFAYHGRERLREVAVSLRRADLALFLNRDDLDFSVARLGVRAGRAHLVRNGLDEPFLGLPPPRLVESRDAPRIALVARHTHGMGAAYYVPALEQLLLRHPRLRVSLLGSAVPKPAVLADFAPAVRNRIDVVPVYERARLPQLLAGHEILVSAKFNEGFGKALVEGMACGLVPVAAASSGAATIVEHAKTGLLVPRRDAAATIEAVELLIADPALRLRLRANAHEAVQRYTWAATADARLALIGAALASRSARPAAAGKQPERDPRPAPADRGGDAAPGPAVEPDVDHQQVA